MVGALLTHDRLRRWMLVTGTLLLVGGVGRAAHAQSFGSATLRGRVVDESSAALPGVSVTASGDALQVPQVAAVTDAEGNYQLLSLPPGTYAIRYELVGFQSVLRQDFRLAAGFEARVDVTLKVGQLEESITVAADSPVVNVASTTVSSNLTKEDLETIPTSKSLGEAIAMAPGVRYDGAVDVGGNRTAQFAGGGTNFGSTQQSPFLEGINVRLFEGGSMAYIDQRSVEEIQVSAVGNDAEFGPPGVGWKAIIKSGGNEFHGLLGADGQRPELQSRNVDEQLVAEGIDPGSNRVSYYWDFAGQLGGRVLRDKLWFFGGLRHIRYVAGELGFSGAPGSDGRYGTADDVPAERTMDNTGQTIKASYQPARSYKVIGFFTRSLKHEFARGASRFVPYESTWNYWYDPKPWKVELEATPSNKVIFDVLLGRSGYKALWRPQDEVPGRPVTQDIATGIQTGGAISAYNPNVNSQATASVTFYPERQLFGRHELKAGVQYFRQFYGVQYPDRANGNYVLILDSGAPFQIQTEDRPASASAGMGNPNVYVRDTWRLGRVTANIGLRFEKYYSWTNDGTKPQGEFGTSGTFDGFNVVDWTAIAPRVGVAWDLFGTGRTVLKMQWGRFNHQTGASYALGFAPAVLTLRTYRWRDTNGDGQYTPGEVNLDPNGPDFVSVTGRAGTPTSTVAASNIVNADLDQPRSSEMSATIEQELAPGLAFRALVVYKHVTGLFDSVNVLRPLGVWNIPVDRVDPGPDGITGNADDGGVVRLYTFPASYAGARFVANSPFNRDDGEDNTYKGFELTLTRRQGKAWSLTGSFQMMKNHVWLATSANPSNPNQTLYPIDDTWDWSGKLMGTYLAPWDVQVSALYNFLAGTPGYRTYQFRSIAQAGTLTVPLEEYGARRTDAQHVVNLRAARAVSLGAGKRLTFAAQVFNAFNSNAATTVSWVSGPAFGAVSEILPPRIARLGVEFSF